MTNTINTKKTLQVADKEYKYFSIKEAERILGEDFSKLPFSLKVVLENLLRNQDDKTTDKKDIEAIAHWLKNQSSEHEIAYRPARVLMQDFTGVPAVVDLAAMRDAVVQLGSDPKKINPLSNVDLVIDHSVMVDQFGSESAYKNNVKIEMERNQERYEFLKWGQNAFDNFRVVPPGTGICHQVNLEYLAKVVWTKKEGNETIAMPDTLVGTDSHTTMINGLSALGWGVGGIEAEAAMLGQPISMLLPDVVGFKLTGKLKEGTTATDLVLTVTEKLRAFGVVGKFVEFFGDGLDSLPLADRATIANMAPEYGATCGFFPIDDETLKYLKLSGREESEIALVETYAKEQGLWRNKNSTAIFSDILELDLSEVEPAIAGPKRPQDKINLRDAASQFIKLTKENGVNDVTLAKKYNVKNKDFSIQHGSIVIAAITSCTNTSNPSVMIAAGLVAKKALEKGLHVAKHVKTSLAPGSKVVTEYLEKSNLQDALDELGFNLVGYGCTTCIGNSGPLDKNIENTIKDNKLVVTSVLSGNRNFEGRVHALTKGNYLMSPPLVVAYALAGNTTIDIFKDPIAKNQNGEEIYLKDIWPTNKEVADLVNSIVTPKMFKEKYADVFSGTDEWQEIKVKDDFIYDWKPSTYIQNPPFFADLISSKGAANNSGFKVENANIIGLFGDSITTDHISPAGVIAKQSPAADYLRTQNIAEKDFNSYGSRRGNHAVMMRGTFANVRIRNEMAPGTEGGYTTYIREGQDIADGKIMSIYDAAMLYQKDNQPLVVIGGKEYGTGSSRDWAAKGTFLLGIKAVIAESFERIHRSNLVGMGVLPLTFEKGDNRKSLKLNGSEKISINGFENGIKPKMKANCTIEYLSGKIKNIKLICRLDTENEIDYFIDGGILHHVIKKLI